MSTKIYNAWCMPIKHLNVFLRDIGAQMFEETMKEVEIFMYLIDQGKVDAQMKERFDGPLKEAARIDRAMFEKVVRCEILLKATKTSLDRNEGFLTCGLKVWIYGSMAYVMPWGHPNIYSKLNIPVWAEDYGYWDNSDRPDYVTRKQWSARRDTWNKIALNDGGGVPALSHDVVSFNPGALGASKILLRYLKPIREADQRG